ncbi:MAG: NAD+ synthase [Halobacteriales archaeon]|nr:NAD+ synthase [Halobacteriales archaeon]
MESTGEKRVEEYVEKTTEFVEESVEEAGADGVVVGLSGGIDSATASAIAVEAVGAENVHGLVMPSEVSDDDNMSDAERHARDFGIDYDVIEIQPIVDEFLEGYSVDDEEAVGNLAARVRMCYNYLVANSENTLVLGTGNRSELLVGYYTKYGDGGVDILPLGGLYKSEVREVARHLGVDESIVEKPPTAGLWEGQTDEEELGATYDELDVFLRAYVDEGESVEEAAESADISVETAQRLKDMYRMSEHKRKTPPFPDFGRE